MRSVFVAILLTGGLLLQRYLLVALLAFATLFTAQLAVVSPARHLRLVAAERRLVHVVGEVVSAALLASVFVVVVLPLWAGAWLFAVDPLRTSRGSSWMTLAAHRPSFRRSFSLDRHPRPKLRRATVAPHVFAAMRWGLRLLVVVALVAGVARQVDRRGSGEPAPTYDVGTAAAYVGQPELHEMLREQAEAWLTVHFVPNLDFELGDYDGQVVNQRDGRRESSSPEGDDPAARIVWFFGGSTMYGIGQRDAHTIPSVFARTAAEAGIPVEVENFGVPAYMTYQQALALEQALREGPPPDLVVFYGGFNDTFSGMLRPLVPGAPGIPAHGFGVDIDALLDDEVAEVIGAVPANRSDQAVLPSTEERYEGVLTQYQRGSALARDLLEPRGIPLVELWQPTVFSRDAVVAGEQTSMQIIGWDDFQTRQWASVDQDLRDRLPDGVVDLGDVFDDTTEPVYTDQVHTNEVGAAIVAEAIFDIVRDLSGLG